MTSFLSLERKRKKEKEKKREEKKGRKNDRQEHSFVEITLTAGVNGSNHFLCLLTVDCADPHRLFFLDTALLLFLEMSCS